MNYRTDLALEAHELWRSANRGTAPQGVVTYERASEGFGITEVRIEQDRAAQALEKPKGTYLTLDLRSFWLHEARALERAVLALCGELRGLLPHAHSAMVVGLGNRAITPDAIGPLTAEHIFVTRHLRSEPTFSSLAPVSVVIPGVLGRTGMEAFEIVRGAVHAVHPDVVLAVDALASRRLGRVCNTVQLSNTGIVPGSGVGNHRHALDRATLGIPVIAVGIPTVVDANTLALDIIEQSGVKSFSPRALADCGSSVMVTPRDIDLQIRELARIVGYGITLALQPQLDFAQLTQLMG